MPDDEAFKVPDDLVRAAAAAISPDPTDQDLVAARRALDAAAPAIFAAGRQAGLKDAEFEVSMLEWDKLDDLCEIPAGEIRNKVQIEFDVLGKALRDIRAMMDDPDDDDA